MRGSDKVTEAAIFPAVAYLDAVHELRVKYGASDVVVITEDKSLLDDMFAAGPRAANLSFFFFDLGAKRTPGLATMEVCLHPPLPYSASLPYNSSHSISGFVPTGDCYSIMRSGSELAIQGLLGSH